MASRAYRILVAEDREGIYSLAGDDWTVLENTVREFRNLNTHDDGSFGEIGRVYVGSNGFVALAFK
ncbi:MAG TPA: hypothetical protein PLA97_02325 [Rubrivivax sp.]|nr:hypothetical protein [Rubrivivax sp.]